MKRYLYITLMMILGWLLSLLVHGLLEIYTLNLITGDLARYGNNFIWQNWYMVHKIGSLLLSVTGLVLGFIGGRYFWQILYVEERNGKPRW